jgi:hypothetical protein
MTVVPELHGLMSCTSAHFHKRRSLFEGLHGMNFGRSGAMVLQKAKSLAPHFEKMPSLA